MIDLVLKAVAYSSGIALTSAGITIIYMATRTFNFAHASMVAWGFYVVFALYSLLGGIPYYYVLFAALFSGLLGVILYYTVNRRLLRAGASTVTLMMSTLGVDLIFFAIINIFADYLTEVHKIPNARYFVLELKDVSLGTIYGTSIRAITLVSTLVVIALIFSLHIFLTKTKFGIAVRATIENTALATVLGINPERVYVLSWFLGGALAGLGGGLLSMTISGYPAVGMTIIVTMFAGSIVGGLYSIFGSLVGGFLVGLSEYLGITGLSLAFGGWILAYRLIIPLIAMVSALLLFPEGLGGIKIKGFSLRLPGRTSSKELKGEV
ncbi:MAG: branched-chain amino acid ABC transporter permease [Thaumarchaeota archaeon]|jgi:branched-chain amino acid transport system permease protein|nr:branched-chain amino acid ABC transporter permease [Candidatus Geocrenenecus arthurdayi]